MTLTPIRSRAHAQPSTATHRACLTLTTLVLLLSAACSSETPQKGALLGIDDGASAGQASSALVTSDKGGMLSLKSGAELSIAPGAVEKDIEISIVRPKDNVAVELVKTLDEKDTPASAPYVLTPHGTVFKEAVTLKVPVSKGADQKKLTFAYLDDEKDTVWKPAGMAKVDNDKATIELKHFSVLILLESSEPRPLPADDAGADAGLPKMDASTPEPPPLLDAGTGGMAGLDACVSNFGCATSASCGVVMDACGVPHDLTSECAKGCGGNEVCTNNVCAPPPCVPKTCAQALSEASVVCHPSLPDGCGGTLSCVSCDPWRGFAQTCVDYDTSAAEQWACGIPCTTDAECPPNYNECAGHDLTVAMVMCGPLSLCAVSAVLADCTNGCTNDACF
ncbi:MAG: hypothetical protein QM778_18535 [Myxococcales bacterium]